MHVPAVGEQRLGQSSGMVAARVPGAVRTARSSSATRVTVGDELPAGRYGSGDRTAARRGG
ncbi:hypothetical protein V2S66_00940 [Streptomyces sp. V4-01]|uniref:Uncharacterized protein n=1 Tax=Actinacidiphila polyblastidii TaxID=3110430 RepID=A0ABU7P5Z9_9ACTN|nr:hypothetical protein [Streptomyces sp. V4-01]